MQIEDVRHLAALARLDIPEEEQASLLEDLKSIIEYVDQVTNAPLSTDATTVPAHRNVMREDIVTTETGAYTEALLAEAPDTEAGFVKVKKIL